MVKASEYNANDLTYLEGLDAVRKRPGMYIGTTDSKGLMHCLYEIIDNSIDEALAGFCDKIVVTLHQDGSFEVEDNGRGIPVDVEKTSKLSGVELIFTKLHAGGKFGTGAYNKVGGLHGVGASVVNALSSKLLVEIKRNGKVYHIEFVKGKKTAKGLEEKGKCDKKETGTKIKFYLDPEIFNQNAEFIPDDLINRLQQSAFLVPHLKLEIKDKRDTETNISQTFYSENGLPDFLNLIRVGEEINPIWRIKGTRNYSENVQVVDENKEIHAQQVERSLDIDIVFQWANSYDSQVQSFVNIISTPFGGTHVTGFEQGFIKVFRKIISQNMRKYKVKENEKLEKEDIFTGLFALITVSLPEPQFEGQTKETLGTPEVKNLVQDLVVEELTKMLTTSKREYKPYNNMILEKVVGEMKSRLSAKAHKDLMRNKNKIESSTLPSKLVECNSNNAEITELFIVEGDSALGTAKLARDSEYQALLPIRGKILNVQKASLAQMLENQECSSIIQSIGSGSGQSFDVEMSRYSKVIIMTDADVDGAHIRILLLTLFNKYLQDLILKGKVYAAVPPLHRIELQKEVNGEKYIYTYSEAELHEKLAELNKKNIKYKEDIQRYKGLGEMDADQLAETTMDPNFRILKRIQPEDSQKAQEYFELFMGDEVSGRKDYIVENSKNIDTSLIDA